MSVSSRFDDFLSELTQTAIQLDNGRNRRKRVIGALNRHYHASSSETLNSTFIGSWAKSTQIRPPRDVDVQWYMPMSLYTESSIIRILAG
ncbi:SMODS domain-containing nucleotidyltransferase [Octadecabacter arcticus]|uniref:SMODS domain-containing nucleotidyltransferase n=1 Tax=Octadecabacter arcticus TaxID=53946 RepID=UPI003B82C662